MPDEETVVPDEPDTLQDAPETPDTETPVEAVEEAPGTPPETVAEGADDEKPPVQDFPDDWQVKMAGDDEKLQKLLGRYASPAAAAKALAEANEKISKGLTPLKAPDADASEEDIAAYREALDIPAEPDKYIDAIQLSDGVVMGDDDKAVLSEFSQVAHAVNITPSQMSALAEFQMKQQEAAAEEQQQSDYDFKTSAIAELKQEMGGAYQGNMNALRPYFDSFNEEIFDNLMGGRMADGTKVGDHPDAVRFFVGKALAANPADVVVPGVPDQAKAIDTEIKEFETKMQDRDTWFKDKAGQERYRQLVEAQEKLKAA